LRTAHAPRERRTPWKALWVLLFSLPGALPAWGAPRLDPLIGDHMVLQMGKDPVIAGWADPGEELRITLAGKTRRTVTDRKGRWRTVFPALEAGGPHELVVQGQGAVTIHDILIGEVWVASGQSNMAFPLKEAHPKGPWATWDQPSLRVFTVDPTVAFRPSPTLPGSWKVCSPGNVPEFSALAAHFARGLGKELKVPVGIVVAAVGGSLLEAWLPGGVLEKVRGSAGTSQGWCDGEERFLAYPKGILFDLRLKDIRFLPERPGDPPVTVWTGEGPGKDGVGGKWIHYERQGKGSRLSNGKDGILWGPPRLGYSGTLREGGWGICSTNLLPGEGTFDLSPYRALEFRYKGKGPVALSVGDPMVEWEGFRYLEGTRPGPEWRSIQVPIPVLLGGPMGTRKVRANKGLKTLAFKVTLPRLGDLPTFYYNGMIAPLSSYPIRGFLWYQGESNATRPEDYGSLLNALIREWRGAWGEKEAPFLIVQLPSYLGPGSGSPHWSEIREAQRKAALAPATGLITTFDLGEAHDLHPKDKSRIAQRAVQAALALAYHRPIPGSGPCLVSATRSGREAVLVFGCRGKGLRLGKGGDPRGFELRDKEGKFHPAKGRLEAGKVILWSKDVGEPTEVRYGWGQAPQGNLYNQEGLPASPFQAGIDPR